MQKHPVKTAREQSKGMFWNKLREKNFVTVHFIECRIYTVFMKVKIEKHYYKPERRLNEQHAEINNK